MSIDAWMEDLKKTLETAPAGESKKDESNEPEISAESPVVKSINEIRDLVMKTLSPGNEKGEGVGTLVAKVAELQKDLDEKHEIIEGLVNTVHKMQTGADVAAVRKSIDGDDTGAPVKKSADGEDVQKARSGEWDGLAMAIRNGRRIELVG